MFQHTPEWRVHEIPELSHILNIEGKKKAVLEPKPKD
jgi:hypothetical protein